MSEVLAWWALAESVVALDDDDVIPRVRRALVRLGLTDVERADLLSETASREGRAAELLRTVATGAQVRPNSDRGRAASFGPGDLDGGFALAGDLRARPTRAAVARLRRAPRRFSPECNRN